MKVLQVTTSSKGGAGIAALRLHDALRAEGVQSGYLSKDLTIDFNGNEIADDFFIYKKPSFFQKVLQKLKKIMSQADEQKLQKKLSSLAPELHYEMISTPYSSYKLENHPLVQESSVINLHMVSIVLDYKRFFLAIKKPIVWTLHDMNPFSGLFHYQGDMDRNESVLSDIEKKLRIYKKKIVQNSSLKAVVGPSFWITDLAIASGVFTPQTIFKTIPNSIASDPIPSSEIQKLQHTLGIDSDTLVLLFIAHSISSPRKGMDLLIGALSEIHDIAITLLVVGKGEVHLQNNNIKTIPLGIIADHSEMSKLYSLADAFILPSREDNLPNVMLESFAVGTAVLSFKHGGMATHIKEGVNGKLAKSITSESLSEIITAFALQRVQFDSATIQDYAKTHFSPTLQAEHYTALYRSILV